MFLETVCLFFLRSGSEPPFLLGGVTEVPIVAPVREFPLQAIRRPMLRRDHHPPPPSTTRAITTSIHRVRALFFRP